MVLSLMTPTSRQISKITFALCGFVKNQIDCQHDKFDKEKGNKMQCVKPITIRCKTLQGIKKYTQVIHEPF